MKAFKTPSYFWKIKHKSLNDRASFQYVFILSGMIFSFGQLIARAICKEGARFGDLLPNPISIRSIVFNDQKMALLCYQLNTLDFDNDEGVKNQVWLSTEFPISFPQEDAEQSKNLLPHLNTSALEFPENEFKELVALLLYGQGEEALQQTSVV